MQWILWVIGGAELEPIHKWVVDAPPGLPQMKTSAVDGELADHQLQIGSTECHPGSPRSCLALVRQNSEHIERQTFYALQSNAPEVCG